MKAKKSSRRERAGERGSALLIVFVLAAIVAIMLYKEMPIVVFEAQRQKEQLLIDRGNEYAHAVKLYVRTIKQYPPNMEALENTNRMRFLRNRYVDPMTGKDDWRLLHAGPNGIIIDSKVKPLNAGLGNANGKGQNNGIGSTGMGTFGGGTADGSLGNSVASNANASFAGFNAAPVSGNARQAGAVASNSNSFGFGQSSGSGVGVGNTGNQNSMGRNNNSQSNSSQPSNTQQSGFSGFFSQPAPANGTGTQGPNGNKSDNPISTAAQRAPAIAANTGEETGQTDENATGTSESPAYIPRGRRPNAAQLAANANGGASVDSNAEATAGRQAQANGFGPQQNAGFNAGSGGGLDSVNIGAVNTGVGNSGAVNRGGSGFGTSSSNSLFGNNSSRNGTIQNPGLAGVASKAAGQSIKLVNDQDNYALWEFFYDPTKDPMRGVMMPQGGMNAQGGIGNSKPGPGTGSPFGNSGNSGFGGGNSFGNTQNRGGFGGNNSSGIGNSGFGGGGFGNGTNSTGSQAPTPLTSPMNRTMSTSSFPQ